MSLGNSVEKLEPTYVAGENANVTVVEGNLAFLPNVKGRITIQQNFLLYIRYEKTYSPTKTST